MPASTQLRPGAPPNSSSTRRDLGRHLGSRSGQKEQRIGDFIIKQTLGKGTFSKVCMAEHRTTKQKFALKFIKPKSPQGGSPDKHNIRVEREIKLLSLLYHPHIVRLYDVVQTAKFTMIVMEHNSGGELLQHIRKRGRLHESEARVFFRQIVSAMDYTHRNCIIHRDLKLENVMLDNENRIRIIDYGFANTFNWDKQLETFCGSPFYAAPEMVNGIKYTGPEVDIWSMGVILFFMLCGRTPFEGENLKEIYDKISRGRFTTPPFLSKDAQDLLQQMLTVRPSQRISMKGIVDHPWTNRDSDGPINNHLPQRPSVVLQPNEQSLKKMTVYNYKTEDVVKALAHSDTALTPMVCIYHLIEESRRRKITKQSRKSHATPSTTATPTGVSNDSAYGSGSPSSSAAPGIGIDTSRPTSRGRHSYVPGHSGGDSSSPTGRTPNGPSLNGDGQQQQQQQHGSGNPGKSLPQPGAYQAQQHQQQQTNLFLTPKESINTMQAAALESPSFGATSQYGPPRMRKSSIGSGQISVGSSLNLESSSPFLPDDKRTSWSSRLFAKVRKSMPFLKNRRSQILNDVPPMQQSQMPEQNRKRMSFFQQPLKRFSVAPSQTSLNGQQQSPQKGRIASYYPSDQHPVPKLPQGSPQRPMTGQPHTASHDQNQQLLGNRPATAHPELHVTPSSDSMSPPPHHQQQQQQNRQQNRQQQQPQQQRRQTDFGPQIRAQHSTPARLLSADGHSNSRKSEPLREPPLAESPTNGIGPDSGDGSGGQKKRAQRPLSVMSSRQLTPLRLHPTQSFQSSTGVPAPYTPTSSSGGGPQLPPALTTRASTSHSMSGNGNAPTKSNVKGLFNLRFTMLGPLDEIRYRLETVMKNKLILYRQTGPCIYVCEYSPMQQGKTKDKMRFDILVEAVQGQLHTVKLKRYSGNWFEYKKLAQLLNNEAHSVQL